MSDTDHRMIPGSHERSTGAECTCGAEWSRWEDRCAHPDPECTCGAEWVLRPAPASDARLWMWQQDCKHPVSAGDPQ